MNTLHCLIRSTLSRLGTVGLCLFVGGSALPGQTIIGWDGASFGSGGVNRVWDRNFNWDGTIPDNANEYADFDATVTGNLTVDTSNLGGGDTPPWTIEGLIVSTPSTATLTLDGDGQLSYSGNLSGVFLTQYSSLSPPSFSPSTAGLTIDTTQAFNTAGGQIFHNSTGDLNINGITTLNATNTVVDHRGSGLLNFNENVNGTGGLTVASTSTGTIDFSYTDRAFTGGLVIDGGTVDAFDNVDDGQHIIIGDGLDEDTGPHMLGSGNVTLNGGTLNLTTANDHIAVNNDSSLTVNGGTLNVTTLAPDTGNDFRLNYGTYTQTGGVANFDLGDDFNMYEGDAGANANEAGQAFISGGTLNVTVRDQFRTFQDERGTKVPTFSVTNGATANITLNGERGTGGSQGGVVAANYEDSNWIISGCGTTVNVDAVMMAASTPNMVNISGNTTIDDGGILGSSVDVVLNRTANLIGDNSANLICSTGPGELQLTGTANLYVNQTPTLTDAPNIAFDSGSNQSIYSITNSVPLTSTGTYPTLASNIGGTGDLSGVGTLRKDGAGTLTIDSSIGAGRIDANEVRIEGGTLLLGADNQFTNTTDLDLDGGIFNSNNFDSSMGALTLSSTSTVDLGSGSGSIIEFTDGTHGAGTFTVVNWSGNLNGGGADQIIFGSALDQAFLDNVFWSDLGIFGAQQLVSGEIVPVPVPEPGTYAAGFALIAAVFAWEWRRRKKAG